MFSPLFAKRLAEVEEAVAALVWRQWATIGGSTTADRAARTIIDPEALILVSLMLPDRSARLHGVLQDWVGLNDGLVSEQRRRNLARDYPIELQPRVAQFDLSLKLQAQERHPARMVDTEAEMGPAAKRPARAVPAPVDRPANLMLRLRLGMGVGAKADTLCVALAEGAPVTVRQIADTTGYTSVSVRSALDDLARAGFLDEVGERRPAMFTASRKLKQWEEMLRLPRIPEWFPLHQLFVFVVEFMTWADKADKRSVSDYAVTVQLRELTDKHHLFFDSIPSDGLRRVAPEELPALLAEHLANLTRWVVEKA